MLLLESCFFRFISLRFDLAFNYYRNFVKGEKLAKLRLKFFTPLASHRLSWNHFRVLVLVKMLATSRLVRFITYNLNWVFIVLFPRHTKKGDARENTINLIHTFRVYLHYHIKSSKVRMWLYLL
jgi:hypothetical protein